RGGLPGRRRCLLVAAETVVQDRGRPVRGGRPIPSPPAAACPIALVIAAEASPSLPYNAQSLKRHVWRKAVPGRRRHAVGLRDERGGTRKVADPRPGQGQRGKVDGQLLEH